MADATRKRGPHDLTNEGLLGAASGILRRAKPGGKWVEELREQAASQVVGRPASHRWAGAAVQTEEIYFRRVPPGADPPPTTFLAIARLAIKLDLGDDSTDHRKLLRLLSNANGLLTHAVGDSQSLHAAEVNVVNTWYAGRRGQQSASSAGCA